MSERASVPRWGRDQVLELAPDASSRKAAGQLAVAGRWQEAGCGPELLWGLCRGSGKNAYQTCVDLTGPAFRCTCPSRKFPCKHALALLLLWSEGAIDTAAPVSWAAEWLAARKERTERRVAPASPPTEEQLAARARTADRRGRLVDAGITEFAQWLRDQVTHGLAGAERAPYALWDDASRRLVDAQAPALAGQLKSLAALPRLGEHWPSRLLEEYGLLHLLVRAYQRQEDLPAGLRATVRTRVGFPTSREEVLAGPPVRDHWYVSGVREFEQDGLLTRRTWLRGMSGGQPALLLSFGTSTRLMDPPLPPGTALDASLAFYPDAPALRALVVERHSPPSPVEPPGTSVLGLLQEYATALSHDPWLERWPAILSPVRVARGAGLHLVDPSGDALPLKTHDPWLLLAISGGGPLTLSGEWTPTGLHPLSAWHPTEGLVSLP